MQKVFLWFLSSRNWTWGKKEKKRYHDDSVSRVEPCEESEICTKPHLLTDSWVAQCLERRHHLCLWAYGCEPSKAPPRCHFPWFSCLFFHWAKSPRGGWGDNVCANSQSVSCVSVQSGNATGRDKKPQLDAISEYVYSGVMQNLNRPFLTLLRRSVLMEIFCSI